MEYTAKEIDRYKTMAIIFMKESGRLVDWLTMAKAEKAGKGSVKVPGITGTFNLKGYKKIQL